MKEFDSACILFSCLSHTDQRESDRDIHSTATATNKSELFIDRRGVAWRGVEQNELVNVLLIGHDDSCIRSIDVVVASQGFVLDLTCSS